MTISQTLALNIPDMESLKATYMSFGHSDSEAENSIENMPLEFPMEMMGASVVLDAGEIEAFLERYVDDFDPENVLPYAMHYNSHAQQMLGFISDTLEIELGQFSMDDPDSESEEWIVCYQLATLIFCTYFDNIAEISAEWQSRYIPEPNAAIIVSGEALTERNPLRYRGYYYDSETGLYYLQTRYYSPEWARFLNADTMFIAGDALTAANLYAYCNGNPVMFVDRDGSMAVTDFLYGIMWIVILSLSWLWDGAKLLWDGAKSLWGGIKSLCGGIKLVWNGVKNIKFPKIKSPNWNIGNVFNGIGKFFKGLFGWIGNAFKGFFGLNWNINFSGIGDFFKELWRSFLKGMWEAIKSALKEFFDWLFRRDKGKNNKYTKEEEKAEDLNLQAKCFALLDTTAFSESTWKSRDVNGKKTFLTDLLKQAQDIMNTSADATIVWKDNVGNGYRGSYTGKQKFLRSDALENKLAINTAYLANDQYEEIAKTIVHEVRHAYQHETVRGVNDHVVSKTTKGWWEKRFPKQWKGSKKPYYVTGGGEAYLAQSIEWDAKHFATQPDYIIFEILNGYTITPEYRGSW